MDALARQRQAISDATLVERILAGDGAAFSLLYSRHARYVAGVVFRILGNDKDLDDIIQETFLDAAHRLDSLREPEKVRSWLVTIAVRRTHRRLRQQKRRFWLRKELSHAIPKTSDPHDHETVRELYQALENLSPKLRVPWVLARIEEQPLAEVAQACEVSLATVKRRIAAADKRLRRNP